MRLGSDSLPRSKMNFIKEKLNAEIILSFFLAFVVLWFGVNEILAPQNWVGLAPEFLKNLFPVNLLILAHGTALTLCGAALVLNIYRKAAAAIIAILLLEIIVNFLVNYGLSDIVARDIGLFGAALAIIFSRRQNQTDA